MAYSHRSGRIRGQGGGARPTSRASSTRDRGYGIELWGMASCRPSPPRNPDLVDIVTAAVEAWRSCTGAGAGQGAEESAKRSPAVWSTPGERQGRAVHHRLWTTTPRRPAQHRPTALELAHCTAHGLSCRRSRWRCRSFEPRRELSPAGWAALRAVRATGHQGVAVTPASRARWPPPRTAAATTSPVSRIAGRGRCPDVLLVAPSDPTAEDAVSRARRESTAHTGVKVRSKGASWRAEKRRSARAHRASARRRPGHDPGVGPRQARADSTSSQAGTGTFGPDGAQGGRAVTV